MKRLAVRFGLGFAAWMGLFTLILQSSTVNDRLVVPFTRLVAYVSHRVLGPLGMETSVSGTLIVGVEGFAVNVLDGCNGVLVSSILVAAVLAFPSSWREKALGLALGIGVIQALNLARVVSLYYLGLRHPALFETFHLYVWQTVIVILSMAAWMFWAEMIVRPVPAVPRPAPARRPNPARG
ncbi:MAG TPA: exosortase H [Candidatus Polarisedimenticolia bacterium]|nr:exosortase H [Candidatus Polarisedimenticolia bacterium]